MLIKDTEIVYSLIEDAASCSKTYQQVKEICENFSESVYLQVIDGNGGKSNAKVNNYVLLHDQITLFFPYGDKMIRIAHTEYGILSEEVSAGGGNDVEPIVFTYNENDNSLTCNTSYEEVRERCYEEVYLHLTKYPNYVYYEKSIKTRVYDDQLYFEFDYNSTERLTVYYNNNNELSRGVYKPFPLDTDESGNEYLELRSSDGYYYKIYVSNGSLKAEVM